MEGQISSSSFSTSYWKRVKILGQGSYGVVFLAKPIMGPFCHVALKVASLDHSSSLVKEKHILQNFIGCPEIVQCIGSEVSIESDCSYSFFYNLVLEYGAGGTLADLVTRRGKLLESEVKEHLRMILRGLSSIHGKGFAHGDLKPDNILVFPKKDGKLQLKIADFGISGKCEEFNEEVLASCDVDPKFRGTPRYMSPESVFYGKINAALDVWSLGCILIEMVSGKPVWSDCTNEEQLMKKLAYYMECPDIPEELSREGRDFLAECFNQNFKQRWTAEMLLQHPYVKEEQRVDDSSLIWNLPNSVEELFTEENRFYGSCFEVNRIENGRSNNLAAVGNFCFGEENKDLKKDDQFYDIAQLIGFNDLVM